MHKRQLWPGELTKESLGGGKYTAPSPTVHQCSRVLGAQDVGQTKSVIAAITMWSLFTSLLIVSWATILFPLYSYKLKQTHFSPSESLHLILTVILTIPPHHHHQNMHIHIYTSRTKLTLFLYFVITIYHNRICIFFFFTKQQIFSAN